MLKILYDGDNQLCNKLLFLLNMYASAIEYNFMFSYDMSWVPEGILIRSNNVIQPVIIKTTIKKFISTIYIKQPRILSILPPRFFVTHLKENQKFKEIIRTNDINKTDWYWIGWPYYDLESLRKNDAHIRTLFSFNIDVLEKSKAKIIKYKHKRSILIGVHMRRGDYKNWKNGKYFYSDSEYRKIMDRLAEQMQKKVTYLLFSNGAIDMTVWKGAEYKVVQMNGSAIMDLCCLSQCDKIIGPPSTFSGMASYIGNKPRMIIEDINQNISEDKFAVWLLSTDTWGNRI